MRNVHLQRSLLSVAACAFALAACKNIDEKELENKIRNDMANQGLKLVSVTCPPGKPLRDGTRFDCQCTDERGTQSRVHIEAVNNHEVAWKLENKFMRMNILGDGLEARLSKRLGKVVDVKCPSDNILIKKGVSLTCDVKVGDKDDKITLTAKDDEASDFSESFVEQKAPAATATH
jgi:hypothetical protein